MLANGSLVGGRFRVLRSFGPPETWIALAEDSSSGERYWLASIAVTASETELREALERQQRFALGVRGLARPVAVGVEGMAAGTAFIAFRAASEGSVAETHTAPWPAPRVAALATRIAAALAALHDQGIAYGCLLPSLVAEGTSSGEVLFGFGVATLATRFGAAGDASQLLPPLYRAPELRAALLPPSPESDLFAFAVLLRELLSPPHGAQAISDGTRIPPISPPLDALLARAQSEDPRARPHDVALFAAEFARLALAVAPLPVPLPQPPALEAVSAPSPVPESPAPLGPAPDPELSVAFERAPASSPALPVLPALPAPGFTAGFAPVPALAPAPASARNVVMASLAVFAGILLMLGGVLGAFLYASHRATSFTKSASASPHAAPPLTVPPSFALPAPALPAPALPAPALPAPEPPLSDDSSLPTAAEAAEAEPGLGGAPRSHAPLVAPGVGPSSFPEEARSVLPVLGSEPIWGTRHAPLTWVVFGDLDCPHTRREWRALETLKASFGDDLRIVFRHRPLREHPHALEAAQVLAGLASIRGARAFFEVFHHVAQGDASLSPEQLEQELRTAGYGDLKLADLARAGEPAVIADLSLAGQFGVRSTPFAFLNGKPIDGERTALEARQLLSDEQRSATWLAAAGVPASALYVTRTSSNLIGVGDPAESRVCAPVADSPVRGPADALVTLVQFSDFECPYCKRAEPTLNALLARYPKSLRLVWKNFPLPQHEHARLLANFALDAHKRASNAGFWAVHDGLFGLSDLADEGALGAVAGKAGLDGALLLIAARAGVHDAKIRADLKLGQKLGVNGTPTFFINGRRVQGALSMEQFDALIQQELKAAQRIVSRGVAARDVYHLICD